MALFKSVQAAGASFYPIPSADGATELIASVADFVTVAGMATNDVIEMAALPAGYVVVDIIIDTESLAGTAFTADVGIMSGAWGAGGTRTVAAQFMTGKAFGTAGVYRADVAGFSRVAPTTGDRSIGILGSTITAPTTSGARSIRMTAILRPQVEGA
jgi:hypothetical protein